MTTETLNPVATSDTATTVGTTESNTYSVLGLVLSILSIPLGMGPLAIAGVVLGFIARTKEPAHVTTANWAIIAGFVSLFGWIVLAIAGAVLFLPWALGAWAFSGFYGF